MIMIEKVDDSFDQSFEIGTTEEFSAWLEPAILIVAEHLLNDNKIGRPAKTVDV